jgi:AmmeMemoRadiSam system protein B
MAGPKNFSVRMPAVAGLFYPAEANECRALAQSYLDLAGPGPQDAPGGRWIGGIVPHAGWICSGAIAGLTVAALARQGPPVVDLVVVFGAVHTPLPIDAAALDSHQHWAMPGGELALAEQIEAHLIEPGDLFRVDDRFHVREHAVEVELPLIQLAWPGVTVLPVEVPTIEAAPRIGLRTAEQVTAAKRNAVYLASSDLTHYGGNYGFAPAGLGIGALEWAKENDRRLLRLVTDGQTEQIVPEVQAHLNACGGGAIAAMMAACRELGATHGRLLRHANSYETLAPVAQQSPNNAVGYAAMIMG